jgi:hypothetical protein
MSDLPADYADRLNLREQVTRIDRQIEESHKFIAEQRKLIAEQQKLNAEADKLASEARKFDRERGLAPWQMTTLVAGSVAALVASLVSLAKSMGWF